MEIKIDSLPPFGENILLELAKINLIVGKNDSGKSDLFDGILCAKNDNDNFHNENYITIFVMRKINTILHTLKVGFHCINGSSFQKKTDNVFVDLYNLEGSKLSSHYLSAISLTGFLAYTLSNKEKFICHSEIENGLHPESQAEMGSILVEMVEKRQHVFCIETNSEHLILRLQKLVRTGRIKPEDVAVFICYKDKKGSRFYKNSLDNEGYFTENWVDGFYPERLREL